MFKVPVSVTIITLNEERNLPRAIQSVRDWVDEIIVVDSGSRDRTREVAQELGAKVIVHEWEGYGKQKNFAQAQAKNDWILNIDADESVPVELGVQIRDAFEKVKKGQWAYQGFLIPRKNFYLGRWITHGGWYPNYLVRFADRRFARWTEPSVHEEWKVDGSVFRLSAHLEHESFSSISDQVLANLSYSKLGSQELKLRKIQVNWVKLLLKPIGKFLESYLIKRGFLDGLPGLIIAVNAAHSIFLKYAYIMEERIQNANTHRR